MVCKYYRLNGTRSQLYRRSVCLPSDLRTMSWTTSAIPDPLHIVPMVLVAAVMFCCKVFFCATVNFTHACAKYICKCDPS